jgi:CheY-like chemotaxis protein
MTPKILLTVESAIDEQLMLRALRSHHIADEVIVVRNATEVLEWLAGRGAHVNRDASFEPRLLLIDLKLSTAVATLAVIRTDARTKQIAVVIASYSNDEDEIATALKDGATRYLYKSVDFTRFETAIGHLATYWSTLKAAS